MPAVNFKLLAWQLITLLLRDYCESQPYAVTLQYGADYRTRTYIVDYG